MRNAIYAINITVLVRCNALLTPCVCLSVPAMLRDSTFRRVALGF